MLKLYEAEEYAYEKLPFKIFNHQLKGREIYTPLHWHRSVEIDLVTSGRLVLKVGEERFVLEENQFQIVNSGILHSNTYQEVSDECIAITILISRPLIDKWLGEDAWFTHATNSLGAVEISQVIQELGEIHETDADNQLKLMGKIFVLMELLKKYCLIKNPMTSKQKKHLEILNQIVDYIDNHYFEDLSLSMVAKEFHYSPEHLSRLFRNGIGVKFYEYLQNVRVLHALTVMKEDTGLSLMSIAMDVGFKNVKSFIENFKRVYGTTPSEWRKKELDE